MFFIHIVIFISLFRIIIHFCAKIYLDPDHELIMNSVIGIHANIWSPEAKKSIQSQVKIDI